MDKALLLIDDQKSFRDSFQTLAQREGYKFAWGKSYEDLEEKLPNLYKKITAVVLDIKCLTTNEQEIEDEGFIGKALTLLQTQYQDLPRVILTGDEAAFELSRFFNSEHIFTKDPEDIERLFAKVNEFSDNHENRIRTVEEREFYKITEGTEGRFLEFKSSLRYCTRDKKEKKELQFEVLKTLAAFSNSGGGTLFIGVEDDKNIYGLEKGDFLTIKSGAKLDNYKLLIDNLITDNFGNAFQATLEEIKFYRIKELTVCKITVTKRHTSPLFLIKKSQKKEGYKAFFVRGQASSRELNSVEIETYVMEHWPTTN